MLWLKLVFYVSFVWWSLVHFLVWQIISCASLNLYKFTKTVFLKRGLFSFHKQWVLLYDIADCCCMSNVWKYTEGALILFYNCLLNISECLFLIGVDFIEVIITSVIDLHQKLIFKFFSACFMLIINLHFEGYWKLSFSSTSKVCKKWEKLAHYTCLVIVICTV